jgi:hypothetical protein
MDRVFIRAVERFAGIVSEIERIDGILGQIRAEADLGEDRTLEVVIPVHAHGVSIHRPVIDHPRQRRQKRPLSAINRHLRAL